ncbi:probable serine/threonine-protein kinase MARK-C [Schistocerca gregaria]|uniref:probable serine/threonine-protein kinase MARK-C n=1 Tax=Schistocerca gregaria TaxID=7010 RepID=UPI00211E2711|nr:probable serine/threonine-protein kinase MARK-C [Schistocerca gregaria]
MSSDKGCTRIGPYELGRTLGEGTFGKVRLGHNVLTKEKVAVKLVHYNRAKGKSERTLVEREKFALSQLDHPHIVKLHQLFDDVTSKCYYIVVEYVGGGELFDYIVSRGRLREKDARKFIRQVVSALDYCHAHLIIHRDLKPENVLLDEHLNVKITDFGLSNIMRPGEKFKTFCGSLHYACPEILRGEEYAGPSADIWSLGVILYCLATGSQPWNASTSKDILHQILHEGIHFPAWLTPECVDLLTRMLCLAEKDRITLEEIKTHPWILKDYDEPPPSYLPPMRPLNTLDDDIMHQLVLIGYQDTHQTRRCIMQGGTGSIITAYHSLLNQKNRKCVFEPVVISTPLTLAPLDPLYALNSLPHPSNRQIYPPKIFRTKSVESLKTSTDNAVTIHVSDASLSTAQKTPHPSELAHPTKPNQLKCKHRFLSRIKVSFTKHSFWRLLVQGTRNARLRANSPSPKKEPSSQQVIEKLSEADLESISLLIQKNSGKCPRIKRRPILSNRRTINESKSNISDLFTLPSSEDVSSAYRAREWVNINLHMRWQNESVALSNASKRARSRCDL